MDDSSEYSVELMGVVEVTESLADAGKNGRVEVAEKCYAAVATQHPINHACLGGVYRDNRYVRVVLDQENIKVFDGSKLETDHKTTSVSTIASIRQSNGSLVYIGRCQKWKRRIGVVLNMFSEEAADQLVYHFLEVRKKRSQAKKVEPLHVATATSSATRPPLQAKPSKTSTVKVGPPGSVKLPSFIPPSPRNKAQAEELRSPLPVPSPSPVSPPALPPKPRAALDRPLPPIPVNVTSFFSQDKNAYCDLDDEFDDEETLSAKEYNIAAQALYPPQNPASSLGVITPKPEQTTPPLTQVQSLNLNDDDSVDYYITIGIKATESECIYMTNSAPWRQKAAESTEEKIRHFMIDEHSYLTSIKNVKEARKFMPPELQNLLRRIDTLVEVHESMYKELYNGYKSCAKIAEVFRSRQEQLEPYKYYMRNSPRISERLCYLPESLLAKYPTLREDMTRSWTRLHYYFMFLGRILDSTSMEEKAVVQEALEMLRQMNLEADAGCHIDAIRDAPFNLESLGTLLLHSSFFIKEMARLRCKGQCTAFLFSEMIILTVPEKNLFQYEEQLPIKQLHFLSTESNSKSEFVLELVMGGQKKNKKFTFQTQEDEKREAWVTEITRLMNKNAEDLKRILARRYNQDTNA